MEMEEIYERITDSKEFFLPCDLKEPSEIQQFFAGKNVLLTGCTGYLGKCTMEKLLRECPDIKKLYLLVRRKKDMSIEKRMENLFDHVLFKRLWEKRPNFMEQVVVIEGDLMLPDMGISAEDRQLLDETADIIIHNAANVHFAASVSKMLEINVLGTKRMLDLACECRHLKAFMYVSTAYSQINHQRIEEKFYPPPVDMNAIQDMIKADTENERGLSDSVVAALVGKWKNIYIFSKAVAESVVQDYSRRVNFSCGVFRMSIVTSTYREPLRAWCDNLNGPVLVCVLYCLGILHTWWIEKYGIFDVVPADMTANAMIATTWDLATHKKRSNEGTIYNYGSSTINPLTLDECINKTVLLFSPAPSMKTVWYAFTIVWKSQFLFYIAHILLHLLPALLLDAYRLLRLKKPKFTSIFIKVEENRSWLEYFSCGDWRVDVSEMKKVWDRMNSTDCELFYNDLRTFDWDEYHYHYWRGIRVYILKDPMHTLEAAIRRYRMLKIAHFSVITFLLLVLLYYCVVPIFRYVYGF